MRSQTQIQGRDLREERCDAGRDKDSILSLPVGCLGVRPGPSLPDDSWAVPDVRTGPHSASGAHCADYLLQ